jgi:hypothetical protein
MRSCGVHAATRSIYHTLYAKQFRTAAGKIGALTGNAMWQQDAYYMIQRRAAYAGIKSKIGNHTFRATSITAYLIGLARVKRTPYLGGTPTDGGARRQPTRSLRATPPRRI